MIDFTEEETKILEADGFHILYGCPMFLKSRHTTRECGCCDDISNVMVSKNDDGTFHATYQPVNGSDEYSDHATLTEAMDAY